MVASRKSGNLWIRRFSDTPRPLGTFSEPCVTDTACRNRRCGWVTGFGEPASSPNARQRNSIRFRHSPKLCYLTAQEAKTPVVEAATDDAAQLPDAMKVWEDGFKATRAMHAARIAIFNGDPNLCEQRLSEAREALELVSNDEDVAKVETDLIAINGSDTG